MTQEEKAKRYDEALERAEAAIDIAADKDLVKGVAITIFPELRENEDERIRKAIVTLIEDLQHYSTNYAGVEPKDMLAYLEKQKAKEQLDRMAPIYNDKESFESALEKAWEYYNKSASRTVDSFEDDYIECVFSKGFREGFLYKEKQKEQKPILEVFGFKIGDAVRLKDGDGRKHIIKSFKEVKGIHGPNFYQVEFEDNSARDGIYPGKEYPNGYYTQMEKLEEEQKPAEWSKKDESYLQTVINEMEANKKEALEYEHKTYDAIILWLKSLRSQPHWKPNDEQMEALNETIAFAPDTFKPKCTLMTLQNDLKKLMEE